VVVMYAGKVAERGTVFDVFDRPSHPYTQGLLRSIPTLETKPKSRLNIIEGMVPGLRDLPKGCRFENRCPKATDICRTAPPAEELIEGMHRVSCYQWQTA
ncbi:MAG: peptide ABC transporter ATP-binding protein, partial [Congregibacter sp.]|nr:peptide ABC transporter ATP-binding protein [Congregibacter sp.]